jgi:hypothetical protein
VEEGASKFRLGLKVQAIEEIVGTDGARPGELHTHPVLEACRLDQER